MPNFPGTEKEMTEFLYPRAYSRHTQLSFPVEESVVCVTLLEGLVDKHIQMLRSHRQHEYFSLLQVLRHDLWSAVSHLSVSFEDLWMYMAPVHELTSSVDRTPLSKNVLPRPTATMAGMDALVLVVIVRAQQRFDQCVLVTSLQAACQGGPSLFRRSTEYLSGLFKHVNNSFVLSSRLLSCETGSALSSPDRKVLQKLEYVTSANKLEDAIMSGRTSGGITASTKGSLKEHVYQDYDPASPDFDPEPRLAIRVRMSDIQNYFTIQSRKRDEEEVQRYHATLAAEAVIQRNITAANTRSKVNAHLSNSSSHQYHNSLYDPDVTKNVVTGRKTFDLTAGRRVAAPSFTMTSNNTICSEVNASNTQQQHHHQGRPTNPSRGTIAAPSPPHQSVIPRTTTTSHHSPSAAATSAPTRTPSLDNNINNDHDPAGYQERLEGNRMYAPSFRPHSSPLRRKLSNNIITRHQ